MGSRSRAIPAVAAFAAASVVGGSAATADKAPTPTSAAKLRLVQDQVGPDSPTPDRPLHGHDIMGLRRELLEKFPATFAGLYRNDDGSSFTVLETKALPELRSCAAACLAGARRDGDTSGSDQPRFAAAEHSLADLEALRDAIARDLPELSRTGLAVFGVGVSDPQNQVIVETTADVDAVTRALHDRYGDQADLATVVAAEAPKLLADRQNDSAPWNGGDMMVSEGSEQCTTGYGAHSGSERVMVTAGHCDFATGGPHKWFNTNPASPVRNSSTYLGSQSANSFSSGCDVEKIPTSTSDVIWTNTASRVYITGWVSPAVGDGVATDGAVSKTKIGTVSLVDTSQTFTVGGTNYTISNLFKANVGNTGGDSGGPMWRNTDYGPLLMGTITSGTSSTTYGTQINADIFCSGGLPPNTTSNP